jgi:ligand-binding sensor domain-containing protein
MIHRAQLQPAIRLGQNFRRERWSMRGPGLVALLAVMLAGVAFNAAGQATTNASLPAQSTEFAIEIWRTDDDLPQNTVTAVLQTRRGYIWIGHLQRGGAIRWPAVHGVQLFHHHGTREQPGHQSVRGLQRRTSGSVMTRGR